MRTTERDGAAERVALLPFAEMDASNSVLLCWSRAGRTRDVSLHQDRTRRGETTRRRHGPGVVVFTRSIQDRSDLRRTLHVEMEVMVAPMKRVRTVAKVVSEAVHEARQGSE